jgi:hypothetical protein
MSCFLSKATPRPKRQLQIRRKERTVEEAIVSYRQCFNTLLANRRQFVKARILGEPLDDFAVRIVNQAHEAVVGRRLGCFTRHKHKRFHLRINLIEKVLEIAPRADDENNGPVWETLGDVAIDDGKIDGLVKVLLLLLPPNNQVGNIAHVFGAQKIAAHGELG